MRIETRAHEAVHIVDLHGRLVLGQPTDSLKEAVLNLMSAGHARILINLRGVPYMDSAGIGELAACKKRVLERRGVIKLLRESGMYHSAVNTLIDLMFPEAVFDDEAVALRSF